MPSPSGQIERRALQRRLYRESESWESFVDHLARRLTGELDPAAAAPSVVPGGASPVGPATAIG